MQAMMDRAARISGGQILTLGLLVVGWSVMYFGTYERLANTIWRTDEQGHGPIIVALSAYLIVSRLRGIAQYTTSSSMAGPVTLLVGLVMFGLGRALSIVTLDVGSQVIVLAGIFLTFKGWRGLRAVLFPIFFLLFMIPLPASLVAAVTAPLKIAVSSAAASLIYILGYPVGRSGVNITIGQYQLLVADACAGLNSMFTLEALGFLYLNIMGYSSKLRNILLACSVIPIAFLANVTRVIVLILVTYYFGDDVGQGFVHQFAGLLLFGVALSLILGADLLFGKISPGLSDRELVPG